MNKTIQVEDLKTLDKFYDVVGEKTYEYVYICIDPIAKAYHIVLVNESPQRLYTKSIQGILNKKIYTYYTALGVMHSYLLEYAEEVKDWQRKEKARTKLLTK